VTRWLRLRQVSALIHPGGLPQECPSHIGALKYVASGSLCAALPLSRVAVMPHKLDLSCDIVLREQPGLSEILVDSLRKKRPVFVLRGTLSHVCDYFGLDSTSTVTIRITATGLIVAFGTYQGTPVAAHAAVSEDCKGLIKQLCKGAHIGASALPELVPNVLAHNETRLLSKRIPGVSPMPWNRPEAQLREAIDKGLKPLEVLLERTGKRDVPDRNFLEALQKFSSDHRRRGDLEMGLALLQNWGSWPGIPSVTVHGDYWLNNFIGSDGEIRGIIDWDRARLNGSAAFDALHLGFMSYAMWSDIYVSELLGSPWTDQWPYAWLRSYCSRIREIFGLSQNDLRRVAALLWLSYFYHGSKSPTPEWEKRMIDPVCRAMSSVSQMESTEDRSRVQA
jgi:hypothetical protein